MGLGDEGVQSCEPGRLRSSVCWDGNQTETKNRLYGWMKDKQIEVRKDIQTESSVTRDIPEGLDEKET